MMTRPSLLLAAVALGLSAGCTPAGLVSSAPATVPAAATASLATTPAQRQVILSGRAQFPTASAFHTLATGDDLSTRATVSLIEPGGAVRAAGVTDAAGNFTLYQSTEPFIPTADTIYTLEVGKRPIDAGNLVAMRTQLRAEKDPAPANTSHWNSITGTQSSSTGILVNLTTTAIAQLGAEDGTLATGGTMDVALDGTADSIETHFGINGADEVTTRIAAIRAGIRSDLDPGALRPGLGSNVGRHDGTINIRSMADLQQLATIQEINGDLCINVAGLQDASYSGGVLPNGILKIEAPLLRKVDGSVTINDDDTGLFGDNRPFKLLSNSPTVSGSPVTLEGLGTLTEIDGSLTISGQSRLNNLTGLEGLTHIGDGVSIENNRSLTSLQGLDNLTDIGGDLDVTGNAVLTTIRTPHALGHVSNVDLEKNPLLTGMGNFSNSIDSLTIKDCAFTTPGSVSIEGNLTLQNLPNLTSLEGLEVDLNQVNLTNLPQLTLIDWDGGVNSNGSTINLSQLPVLANLDAFSNLRSCTSATFNKLDRVTDLDPFMTVLTSLGSLTVTNNPVLTSLGFTPTFTAALSTASVSLTLNNNSQLCDNLRPFLVTYPNGSPSGNGANCNPI